MNLVEGLKNIMIVLLSVSAFMLAAGLQESTGISLFEREGSALPTTVTSFQGDSQGVVPVAMMLTAEHEGGVVHYGVQYQSSVVEELFLRHVTLLQEGFTQGATPISISQDQFLQALITPPAIYFDFLGDVPLAIYASKIAGEEIATTALARRMVLGIYEGESALYFQGGDKYYVYPTPLIDRERLGKSIEDTRDNGARFAFMTEEYSQMDPLTLLLEGASEAAIYEVTTALTQPEETAQLVEGLGFSLAPNYQYSSSNSTVIRNGSHVLRLFHDGLLTYQVEGGEPSLFRVGGESPTQYEMVEGCLQIVLQVTQNSGVSVYLKEITTSGAETTLTFVYTLNGVEIAFGEDEVEFLLHGNQIHSFSIPCRNYVVSNQITPILPYVQAQAAQIALGYEGMELRLAYADKGGNTVEAGWTAR